MRLAAKILAILILSIPAFGQGAFTTVFNTGSVPSGWHIDTGSAPGNISGVNVGTFAADHCLFNQGYADLMLTQSGSGQVQSVGCELSTDAAYGYGTYTVIARAASNATTPNGSGSAFSGSDSSPMFTYQGNPVPSATEIDSPEIEGQFPNTLEWTNWKTESAKQFTSTTLTNPQAAFHTYKFIWQPGRIDYYVDGSLVTTHTLNIPTLTAPILSSLWGTNSSSFGGFASPGVTRHQYVQQISFTPLAPGGIDYYVSPTGSDSNPGTLSQPWKTIQHADSALSVGSPTTCTLGGITYGGVGACVHVMPGSYAGPITTSHNGTSSARIIFGSDTLWAAKFDPAEWTQQGNYTDIDGFEMTGSSATFAIDMRAGVGMRAQYNYIHDINLSACTPNGVIHEATLPALDYVINANIIRHFGGCASGQTFHGIYTDGDGAIVTNNVISGGTGGWAIQKQYQTGQSGDGNSCKPGVIANNTLFDNAGGVVINEQAGSGGSSGCTFDYWTFKNNLITQNGVSGARQSKFGVDWYHATGIHTLSSNNMVYGNLPSDMAHHDVSCTPGTPISGSDANGTAGGCPNQNGASDPAPSITFSNFLPDTNTSPLSNYSVNNYKLGSSSKGNGGGTSSCAAPPGLTPCAPTVDRSGSPESNPPPIGAFTGSVAPPPPPSTYYVSAITGNDANNGTTPTTAWKTFQKAIAAYTLGPNGALIHFSQGTYSYSGGQACYGGQGPSVCISRGGNSATQPLILQCDSQWTVPSSSTAGCKVFSTSNVIMALGLANFVTIRGFEFSGANVDVAMIAGCDDHNPTQVTGTCPSGNGFVVEKNYIHDVGQADGCASIGAVNAGPQHGSSATYSVPPVVRWNRFQHIGNLALARKNGGTCNQYHAVYLSTPKSTIEGNLFLDVVSFSVSDYSYPCGSIVSNNTIVRDGASGITYSGSDCPFTGQSAGRGSLVNNIILDSGQAAIDFLGDGSCTTGTPNLVSHNATGGNPDGLMVANPGHAVPACDQGVGNVTSATGSQLFVNYLGSASTANGNDDLHLKSTSQAIGFGSPTCVTGVSNCTPSLDFDGNAMSLPLPAGAYTSGGTPPPPPPTGNLYYVAKTGSDSNDGSQAHPWLTISHAFSAFSLGALGSTIYVDGGTYTETVSYAGSGSPTQPIVLVSTTPGAAKIVGSTGDAVSFGTNTTNHGGNYVTMKGFEVTCPGCDRGIVLHGNNSAALSNVVHHVQTGGSCPGGGGAGISVAYNGVSSPTIGNDQSSNVIDGNFVYKIGSFPAFCNLTRGIYLSTGGNFARNNLVLEAAGDGIRADLFVFKNALANNTVVNVGASCIFTSADSTGTSDDGDSIVNNIAANCNTGNSGSGIRVASGGSDAEGPNNFVSNNAAWGNTPGDYSLTNTTAVNPVTGTNSSVFVHYTGDETGDYHLALGSPAIVAGTRSCSPVAANCTPNFDFDGKLQSNPIGIGAFTFGSSTAAPVLTVTPPSFDFGTVNVGTPVTHNFVLSNIGGADAIIGTVDFLTSQWDQIATGLVVTTYTDSGVANGTTYNYAVTAVDSSGNESTKSAPTTAIIPGSGTHSVLLNWSSVVGAVSYNVYRMLASGSADYSETDDCSTLPPGFCTMTVTFTPTQFGQRATVMRVPNNSSVNPALVPLTGFGGSITPPPPGGLNILVVRGYYQFVH